MPETHTPEASQQTQKNLWLPDTAADYSRIAYKGALMGSSSPTNRIAAEVIHEYMTLSK